MGDATLHRFGRARGEGPLTLKRPDRTQVRLHTVTIAFSGVVAIVETPQHVTPNAPQIGGSVVRCGSGRFHAWCPYPKLSAVLIPPRLTSHSPDVTCAVCEERQQPSKPEAARQLAIEWYRCQNHRRHTAMAVKPSSMSRSWIGCPAEGFASMRAVQNRVGHAGRARAS